MTKTKTYIKQLTQILLVKTSGGEGGSTGYEG